MYFFLFLFTTSCVLLYYIFVLYFVAKTLVDDCRLAQWRIEGVQSPHTQATQTVMTHD